MCAALCMNAVFAKKRLCVEQNSKSLSPNVVPFPMLYFPIQCSISKSLGSCLPTWALKSPRTIVVWPARSKLCIVPSNCS